MSGIAGNQFVLGAFALVSFVLATAAAFRFTIRARVLEDTPTSKVRSAQQGYVELQGIAVVPDGLPIESPLTGRQCVWWSFAVHQRKDDKWRLVRRQASDTRFVLRDATGWCSVDPEGADVFPTRKKVWRGRGATVGARVSGLRENRRYRFTEYFIPPGEQICVIGMFKTFIALDRWDEGRELSRKLREWKRDQKEFMSRFDSDRDGVLNAREWEAARAAARRELDAQKQATAAQPGVHLIAAPADRRPFLIAPLDSRDFAARLKRRAQWLLVGAVVSGVALAFVLLSA